MSIILELRNGDIIIPNKFYDSFLDFDWFISKLINFSDSDKSNTNPIKKYSSLFSDIIYYLSFLMLLMFSIFQFSFRQFFFYFLMPLLMLIQLLRKDL